MPDTPGHGSEKLWEYWLRGPGAAKIAWGTTRDYTRCVALLGAYVPANQVEGYCAKLHFAANGFWPGDKRNK
jgi:hypothetical protein